MLPVPVDTDLSLTTSLVALSADSRVIIVKVLPGLLDAASQFGVPAGNANSLTSDTLTVVAEAVIAPVSTVAALLKTIAPMLILL